MTRAEYIANKELGITLSSHGVDENHFFRLSLEDQCSLLKSWALSGEHVHIHEGITLMNRQETIDEHISYNDAHYHVKDKEEAYKHWKEDFYIWSDRREGIRDIPDSLELEIERLIHGEGVYTRD